MSYMSSHSAERPLSCDPPNPPQDMFSNTPIPASPSTPGVDLMHAYNITLPTLAAICGADFSMEAQARSYSCLHVEASVCQTVDGGNSMCMDVGSSAAGTAEPLTSLTGIWFGPA